MLYFGAEVKGDILTLQHAHAIQKADERSNARTNEQGEREREKPKIMAKLRCFYREMIRTQLYYTKGHSYIRNICNVKQTLESKTIAL